MGSVCKYIHTSTMKILLFISAILVVNTLAAKTCLQDWKMHEMEHRNFTSCHCYYFADQYTRVSHADATAICKSKGGWLAEIDDTNWHYVDNAWIVDQLLNLRKNEDQSIDTKGPHYEDQWWIGALSTGPHTEEHPGEWIWEHANTTVQWFDWAPREPNNYHRQQCLVICATQCLGLLILIIGMIGIVMLQ